LLAVVEVVGRQTQVLVAGALAGIELLLEPLVAAHLPKQH
jgi:hypothetical protein